MNFNLLLNINSLLSNSYVLHSGGYAEMLKDKRRSLSPNLYYCRNNAAAAYYKKTIADKCRNMLFQHNIIPMIEIGRASCRERV